LTFTVRDPGSLWRKAAAAALLFAAGCATVPPPAPLVRVEGEEHRIESYLAAARASASQRRAVRAVGKLSLESPRGSGDVREVIVVERPGRLRLEALNVLGQTQALLVADGERFAFYDGSTLQGGPLSDDVLREHLGIDLEPGEAVDVLLGAPRIQAGPPLRVLGQGEDRIAELDSQLVRFGANGELRGVASLGPSGLPRWSVEYSSWRDAGAGQYPFSMILSFPRLATRAELRVREAELNPQLDTSLFHVPTGRSD
jgi:outer membrane lipoprotein-sorting protein